MGTTEPRDSEATTAATSDALVLFGATGDLTHKMTSRSSRAKRRWRPSGARWLHSANTSRERGSRGSAAHVPPLPEGGTTRSVRRTRSVPLVAKFVEMDEASILVELLAP
jgi:hypothetical protein